MTRYFIDFFVKMDSMSGCGIRLLFTFRPKTVHCSTKNAYTSEITFLALVPSDRRSNPNLETSTRFISISNDTFEFEGLVLDY